jgi:hypothetical protein
VDGAAITERVTRKEASSGTVHAGAIDELKEEVETL